MMTDLRTRIAAVLHQHLLAVLDDEWIACRCDDYLSRFTTETYEWHVADAVIAKLNADRIYRYACPHCGDFWFDQSERMQRFALLHGRSHRD